MSESLIVNLENHRSRKRIKEMGEVFTPENYVQQMLNLLESKVWSEENAVFFEPTAGHGNIVVPILGKRIDSLARKYQRLNMRQPTLHAIANAVDTLWAVDICPLNVELTRKRVLSLIRSKYDSSGEKLTIGKARDYWAHILSAIIWQIRENEVLSGLTHDATAETVASRTRLGKTWIKKNGHILIDFEKTWSRHFLDSYKTKDVPDLFLRASRFFDASIVRPNPNGFDDFRFAKEVLHSITTEAA